MEQKHVLGILVLIVIVLGGYYFWYADKTPVPLVENQINTQEEEEKGENTPVTPGADSTPVSPGGAPLGPDRVTENGVAVTIIYLTSLGFSPHEVTVNAGEEVRFINKTEGAMRIGTVDSASSQFYSAVTQPNVVGTGGTFQAGLIREGVWSYQNLINPKAAGATGVIYVR